MPLANLAININTNVSNHLNAMADVRAVTQASMFKSSEAVSKFQNDFVVSGNTVQNRARQMSADMGDASTKIAAASAVSADSVAQIATSADVSSDAVKRLSTTMDAAGERIKSAMTPEMSQATSKAKELATEVKDHAERTAIIMGLALVTGVSAVVFSAAYAAYKSAGFLAGLITGESYKSEEIDMLTKRVDEVKKLREEYQLTTIDATALYDAMQRLEETDGEKVSQQEIQKSKQRLDDYILGIGTESVQAVERYQTAVREFENENRLMSEGIKRAWADNTMPALTLAAEFFKDGWPVAVRAFRYTLAEITSLAWGLKTSFDVVYDVVKGTVLGIVDGLIAAGKASVLAMTGDIAGARSALVEGWKDIKGQVNKTGQEIVADATRNANAMKLAWGFDNRTSAGLVGKPTRKKEAEEEDEYRIIDNYQKYISQLESLNRQISAINPDLSKFDRESANIYETVLRLATEMPEYNKSWNAWGEAMEHNIKLSIRYNQIMAEMKTEIRALEDALKDTTGFIAYGKGISQQFGIKPQSAPAYSLMTGTADNYRNRFSLTGPAQSSMFGGMDETGQTQREKDELLKIEEKYQKELLSLKMEAAAQSLDVLRSTSEKGSAIAIAALVAQKALTIAQIMMNSEVAATAALLPPPVGLGPIAGQGLAAEIRAMGYISAGIAGAAGAIQLGQEISGRRAGGGPVSAGASYLIGEDGPEVLTMGPADGYITPNNRLGGNTYAPTFNIDARGSTMTADEFRTIARQETERGKTEILNSMNRGGTYAIASGRRR